MQMNLYRVKQPDFFNGFKTRHLENTSDLEFQNANDVLDVCSLKAHKSSTYDYLRDCIILVKYGE